MKIQQVYYSYRIKLAFFKEYNDFTMSYIVRYFIFIVDIVRKTAISMLAKVQFYIVFYFACHLDLTNMTAL